MTRLVELPATLAWSGPARPFDLDDPGDRLVVYENVLREGSASDIRRYIDPTTVLELPAEHPRPAMLA